jgi:hypothetical protein
MHLTNIVKPIAVKSYLSTCYTYVTYIRCPRELEATSISTKSFSAISFDEHALCVQVRRM